MKIVTFCGHSTIDFDDREHIADRLYAEIEKLISDGATEFLLGGYGAFDLMCAYTVKQLKQKYPHINSVLVIPYINRDFDKSLYDYSEYPPIETTPKRYAILKRNKYMVDKSDVIISYVKRGWGGAAKTLDYAKRKKLHIIDLL